MFLVGLSWSDNTRTELEANYSLAACKLNLTFVFDYDGNQCFPRLVEQKDKNDRTIEKYFADFALFMLPSAGFQILEISMGSELIEYQLHAGAQAQQVIDN